MREDTLNNQRVFFKIFLDRGLFSLDRIFLFLMFCSLFAPPLSPNTGFQGVGGFGFTALGFLWCWGSGWRLCNDAQGPHLKLFRNAKWSTFYNVLRVPQAIRGVWPFPYTYIYTILVLVCLAKTYQIHRQHSSTFFVRRSKSWLPLDKKFFWHSCFLAQLGRGDGVW